MENVIQVDFKDRCCICGKPLNGWVANPWPVVKDETGELDCCQECDVYVVFPARLEQMGLK